MRILVAGIEEYPYFAPAWHRALCMIGHQANFLDLGRSFSKGIVGRCEYRLMLGSGVRRCNNALLTAAREYAPDVVLVHNGNAISAKTIRILKERCWVAGYHHDDPFGYFGSRRYFRPFIRALTSYNSQHVVRDKNVSQYHQAGVRNVRVLMRYYSPWLHYPGGTYADKDVVFVGHPENDGRARYLSRLLRAGVNLEIFGSPVWNSELADHPGLRPVKPAIGEHYRKVLTSTRICLAFHSGANHDRDSYRVYEIPACGAFLLAQRTELMQTLYKEGEEAEFFSSEDELLGKTQFYLRNDAARLSIAAKGYRRCIRSGYDIQTKMNQWLQDTKDFMNV